MKAKTLSLLFPAQSPDLLTVPADHYSRLSKCLLDKIEDSKKTWTGLAIAAYLLLGVFPTSVTCLLGAFRFINCQLVVML